jgi:hypothetical protein
MRWTRRPAQDVAPTATDTIPFVAYTTDSVVSGVIGLESERLSDLLTAADAYSVRHAEVEPLGDGAPLELGDLIVVRNDICIVAGTGPRGNPARRVRTQPHWVYAGVGPYEVWGYLHAVPGADAIAAARSRQIIPMTDCWIQFPRLGRTVERAHHTVLINRQQLTLLEHADAPEDVALETAADAPDGAIAQP